MADGLLLTRRERARLFWSKFAGGVGPSLIVAIAALAIDGGATAWAIAIFGVLIGSSSHGAHALSVARSSAVSSSQLS